MKRLRSLNAGRARIWWITHRQDAVRAGQLVTLVLLFLTASSMDYRDQIDAERAAKDAVTEQLAQERAARGLPRVTFVIDAKDIPAARMRLAEIEGAAMAERYGLRGVK